jgi:hypothetical protein
MRDWREREEKGLSKKVGQRKLPTAPGREKSAYSD